MIFPLVIVISDCHRHQQESLANVLGSAHASLSHPSRYFGARDWIACCDVKL